MTELRVTMTTDELVEEIRQAQFIAFNQGVRAGSRWADKWDASPEEVPPPSNPYGRESQEAA